MTVSSGIPGLAAGSGSGRFEAMGPWRRMVGFVAGLLACLLAANQWAVATRVDVIGAKYRELFGATNPARVVIWGTSHACEGVDPHALEREGLAVYNFSFFSSNPSFYLAFYQDLVRYYARPKVILFGLDPTFLKRFAWSLHYAQDSEYWPWPVFFDHLGRVEGGVGPALLNRFALVKERDRIQDRLAGIQPRVHFVFDKLYKGYTPVAPKAYTPVPEGSDFPDDPTFAADFTRLLDRLKADGVRVVFFQTPEFLRATGDHPVDNRKLAAIADHYGIPFLNYNLALRSTINGDASLFNDGGHLNVAGAERFSPVLAHDLWSRGLLSARDR